MHLFQVGVGSGGMVVLDLVARDPAVSAVAIIDPDVYSAQNVYRHVFPASGVGSLKVELAARWLRERRPDLKVEPIAASLTDPAWHSEFVRLARGCDVGVSAVDNEPAKYAFDALMRNAGKPWTLGEVLSGGIGGWVHRFVPGGPCYGCLASHLQRTVTEEPAGPAPDYSNPSSRIAETTTPASKASIEVIAGLHAVLTLELLSDALHKKEQELAGVTVAAADSFTSLLFTLRIVPGVFEEAYRSYRFKAPRSPNCLVCAQKPTSHRPESGENLDVALDQALDRLGPK